MSNSPHDSKPPVQEDLDAEFPNLDGFTQTIIDTLSPLLGEKAIVDLSQYAFIEANGEPVQILGQQGVKLTLNGENYLVVTGGYNSAQEIREDKAFSGKNRVRLIHERMGKLAEDTESKIIYVGQYPNAHRAMLGGNFFGKLNSAMAGLKMDKIVLEVIDVGFGNSVANAVKMLGSLAGKVRIMDHNKQGTDLIGILAEAGIDINNQNDNEQ